ncbi:GNAT family N-acetyltransferase [Edaphobacter flagellatus]|uniref:GNAT family N-acetyltransferase n=1 Tax=Edaphobacter flagellatus TaxID=1933044 RepID=UPI0021B2BB69|nr:GNAT family N-acetyltransferase [Edaphobacter flagellatus]
MREAMQWSRGTFHILTDQNALDLTAIQSFLNNAPWSYGLPLSKLKKALRHSLCFSLLENHVQIGLARVITDYTTYAYLCDVYILEEFRGQGLGSWLIQCVLEHPELQGLRRISLLTHDAQTFYKPLGFAPLLQPERYMERPLGKTLSPQLEGGSIIDIISG